MEEQLAQPLVQARHWARPARVTLVVPGGHEVTHAPELARKAPLGHEAHEVAEADEHVAHEGSQGRQLSVDASA